MTRARPLAAVGALVVAVAVVVAGVDTVAAARAEHRLSLQVRPPVDGIAEPLVTVGAWPFLPAAADGHLDSLAVRVEGVPRPRVGPVVVTLDARDVTVPEGTGRDLDTPTVATGEAEVSVYLTGDDLARALRLEAVVLASGRDSSLAGRPEHTARLTGTDPVTGRELTGEVRLVVDDRGARLDPVDEPRLALDLPDDLLPLGARVTSLSVRSGSVVARGGLRDRTLALADLARPADR